MKGKTIRVSIFFLLFCLVGTFNAQDMRRIDVGKLQASIFDDGIQSKNYAYYHCSYRRGNHLPIMWDIFPISDEILDAAGTYVGNRNWTDTLGVFWPYHVTGHAIGQSIPDSNTYQFNIPDEMGFPIRRIFSYPPPQIIVDGQHWEPDWGFLGDEVAPEKVWGTADVMIECHYRLSCGMDVYQRNLAWSQQGHDDYVIWDLMFINTGNTDRDDDIELPDQNLDSVIIMKHYDAMPNAGNYPFGSWAGVTEDHDMRLSYPQNGDSLRINYIALARKANHDHDSYGDVCELDWGGDPTLEDGCRWTGHAILFAPKNTSVPQGYPIADITASNDPAQPSMHSTIEGGIGIYDIDQLIDTNNHRQSYRCMRMGIHGYEDTTVEECQNVYDMSREYDVYDTTAMGARTYYDQPQDRMGELGLNRGRIFPRNWIYYTFYTTPKFTIGPYNMEFGDTLRFVYAVVAGSIDSKAAYLLSEARASDSARYFRWVAAMDSATIRQEYERRDPVAELYGDQVYMGGGLNEIATDYVISTGKDSLFNNGLSARRNFNSNYNIPASPAPPSVFEVSSRPDMIELDWSYEPGYEPSDLAGFKIYRAEGGYKYQKSGDIVTGDWQLIDSLGPSERNYEDTLGLEFNDYYYYSITTVDTAGIESGRFLTMTPIYVEMTADFPGENLEDIRVVPNPLYIAEDEPLFEPRHKIAFRELPPICTISILTESGELMSTIVHDNLSGTEYWEEQWDLISSGSRRPASGIYIAHIETPDGRWIARKFVIVR